MTSSVRIFYCTDPRDHAYAQASLRGTWEKADSPCPGCGVSRTKRVAPLIIDWEPGSDLIGDFTWVAFGTEVVVTERVRLAMGKDYRADFKEVIMVQDPRLRQPRRFDKRTKPRVWLPCEGAPLWELVPIGKAQLDRTASNWVMEPTCNTCGRERWRVPPNGGQTVVERRAWTSDDLFTVAESGGIYCVERFKRFVESRSFTNIRFIDDGWISD